MRVAMIVNRFPTLSETFVLDQITGLLDSGHEVDIFAREPSGEPVVHSAVARYELGDRLHILGIPVMNKRRRAMALALRMLRRNPLLVFRTVNRFKYPNVDALFLLARSLDCNCDVAVAQFGHNGEFAARLKEAGMRWSVLTVFRGYDIRRAHYHGPRIYRSLFRVGDLFLGVSQQICRDLRAFGADPDRVVHHPSGIDLDRFCQEREAHRWSPGEPLVLLTVARLHEVKGLTYGLKALQYILERNPTLNVEYRLVGHGPQEGELRELSSQLAIQQHVRLLGAATQDEVAEQYRQAHIFILPSTAEGLSVAVREAMASQLPVVTTSLEGSREFVAPRSERHSCAAGRWSTTGVSCSLASAAS